MSGIMGFKVPKKTEDVKEEEKIDMKMLMMKQDQQDLDPKDVGKIKDIGGVK